MEPLYTEVYKKIREGIRNGEYPEGTPLPAERFLCEKYHVSRSTLRTALTMLNKEGLVYTMAGAGTFVQPTYYIQEIKHLYSFSDTLKSENITVKNALISYNLVFADQTLMRKTKCVEGSVFHKIVRLRYAEECPVMIEASYLPQNRFEKMELNEIANGSIHEFLKRRYDFRPARATEQFRPIIPLPNEKELLQIFGNIPCMLLERFTYEKDSLGEYKRTVVRGDKYIFEVELE